MAQLQISAREVNGTPVLDLDGEIDSYTAAKLRQEMVTLLESGKQTIVLDMSNVHYIDSTGLGTLVAGLKRAAEHRGTIRIVCPNDQIYKVFNITGLVKVFPIFDSEDAALLGE